MSRMGTGLHLTSGAAPFGTHLARRDLGLSAVSQGWEGVTTTSEC